MPNEFEKQVQQMMGELKLVPSEPVWQKVELQIRKKKDRRRAIFWMIFLALLLGGGLWIGVSEYSNKTSYKKDTIIEKQSQKDVDNNLPVKTTAKTIDQKTQGHTTTIKTNNRTENKKTTAEEPKAKKDDIVLSTGSGVQKNLSKKINNSTPAIIKTRNSILVKPSEVKVSKASNTEVIVNQSSVEKVLKEAAPNLAIQSRADTANEIFQKKKIETPNSIIDSVAQGPDSSKSEAQKQDTASVKKASIKKYVASKWKLNLVATAGSSNNSDASLFEGLFGGGEKSLAAPNYSGGGSQSGGLPLYYGPSDIKEGFSFAFGAVAKKQLAKKAFFSAGLRYNYYSNTIQVGNRINQNRMLMDFSVSQYYSNTGTTLQPYHNRYHFVSIPVAMDWQLLKKAPLNFYTGLSLQYLVKTNGLVFDNTTQSYFYSKHAFNRVQLFFEPALTYSVSIKQNVLTFGPQLQYALTRLEKNNSTYHLTSYGLKAQLQFGKK
jgi:hypothetical protein